MVRGIDMKHVIVTIIILMSLTGYADALSEVSLIIPSQRINVGDTFDIKIHINPKGSEIAGAQANFIFNKSILRINRISEGTLFRQYGANTYFFITKIDNQAGEVYNIVDVILGRNNVSTPATFVTVNVTAIGTGYACLNLSNVKIASPEAQPVPLFTVNQSVNSYSISDINGDWTTDLMDIVSVSQHFGETTSYPYPSYDVNRDRVVDIFDIVAVSSEV